MSFAEDLAAVRRFSAVEPESFQEILDRQQADQARYGRFNDQSPEIVNRTDARRLRDSEAFLADFLSGYPEQSAIVVDIGSGLGHPDPALAGATVRDLRARPEIAQKARAIVATDIPSERGRYRGDLDTAEIPTNFRLPVGWIASERGNAPLWVLRSANSIDLLMDEQQTERHFQDMADQAHGREVVYLYNKHILYKPKDSEQFRLIGDLSNAGFAHRGKAWREHLNRQPYTLRSDGRPVVETRETYALSPALTALADAVQLVARRNDAAVPTVTRRGRDVALSSDARRGFTADDQVIRDTLNARAPASLQDSGLPRVAPAPPFRPEPLVLGDADLHRRVQELLRVAPELRGEVREILSAPTPDLLRLYALVGVDPNIAFHGRSGVAGHWDRQRRTMYIRPRHEGDAEFRPGTLAHESAHVRGYDHDSGVPDEMSRLAARGTGTVNVGKGVVTPAFGGASAPVVGRRGSDVALSPETSLPHVTRRGSDVRLPAQDEAAFRRWYAEMAQRYGLSPDPDASDQFYDYRAAFRAGAVPDVSGHWPSQFKKPGHPSMVVGGFNVQTGERVPGTSRASESELIRLGWDANTAAQLARTPEPATASGPIVTRGGRDVALAPESSTPQVTRRGSDVALPGPEPFNPPRLTITRRGRDVTLPRESSVPQTVRRGSDVMLRAQDSTAMAQSQNSSRERSFAEDLAAVRQSAAPPPPDDFAADLAAVRAGAEPSDPAAMSDRERVAAGLPPAGVESRSTLGRAVDFLLSPLASQEWVRSKTGAVGELPSVSPVDPVMSFIRDPRRMALSMVGRVMPPNQIEDALRNVLTTAVNEPGTIPSMIKGALQGSVEGGAMLSDPVTLVSMLTGAGARAVRPMLARALQALPEAERAIIAMRMAGRADEVARLRGEIQAARSQADMARALSQFARGVDVGASGVLAARGVERTASAEDVSEAGAGVAETALGVLGVRTAPRVPARTARRPPDPAGLLPGQVRPGYVVTPEGVAGTPEAIPMRPAPDGSFTAAPRARVMDYDASGRPIYSSDPTLTADAPRPPAPLVPAGRGPYQQIVQGPGVEPLRVVPGTRHPVRGLLPPGPRFVAGPGGVAHLEDAARVAGDTGARIQESAGQWIPVSLAEVRREARKLAKQSKTTEDAVYAEFGLPRTAEDLGAFQNAQIARYVEEPARELVKQLLSEGKRPVSSNAYGPGERGVWWQDRKGREHFTPLNGKAKATDGPMTVQAVRYTDPDTGAVSYISDPSGPARIPVSEDERAILRVMADELEEFGFTPRIRNEWVSARRGKEEEWLPGAGGTPLHHDLNPGGLNRADVAARVRAFADTGLPSAIAERALRIARTRLHDATGQRPPAGGGVFFPPESASYSRPMILSPVEEAAERARRAAAKEREFFEYVDEAADYDASVRQPGEREPGEEGYISPFLLARMGGAVGGAATGYASAETDEDRLQRALVFATAGALAPSLLTRGGARGPRVPRGGAAIVPPASGTAALDDAVNIIRGRARGRAAQFPTTDRPAPAPARPRQDPMRGVDVFIEKFPDEFRTGIREVIEQNAGFDAQRRGVVNQAQVERLAAGLAVDVKRTLKPGTALNAEAIRVHSAALLHAQDKVRELAIRMASGQNADADVLALEAARAEVRVLAQSLMGARSEAGRALAQFRPLIRALQTGNPAVIGEAADLLRGDAAKFATEFLKLPDEPMARFRWLQAQDRPKIGERLRQYYLANILSGVKTHERNALGNAFNAVSNLLVTPTAAGVDALKAAIGRKPRTIYLSEIPSQVAGTLVGVERGISEALFSLKHGVNRSALTHSLSAAEAGKLDVPRVEFRGGGKNPLNYPGRLLDSADQFFRAIARSQEAHGLAHAQAKREGLTGAAFDKRMAALLAGEGDDGARILEQADIYARRAVFQEKGGPLIGHMHALAKKYPAVSFVVPFIKTPGNILRQGFEFSPAGFAMPAARAGERAGAQAQARAVLGSMGAGALAWLAATGRLSGSGPSDRTERAQLMESGWRPNSIKIGDQWVEIALFQPISVQAMAIANAFESWRSYGMREADAPTKALEAVRGFGRSVLDLSFMSGLADLFEAFSRQGGVGAKFASYLGRVGSGLVPLSGAQRSVAQAIDPVVRQPEGIVEQVKTGVPGVSRSVPGRLDRWGNEITRPGGPMRRTFDVFNITPESADPVLREIGRLKARVGFPSNRIAGFDLTREQERIVSIIKGQATYNALQRMFAAPSYQRVSDGAKARAIERIVQKVRTAEAKRLTGSMKREGRLPGEREDARR